MFKSRKNVCQLCSRWNVAINIHSGEEQSYTVAIGNSRQNTATHSTKETAGNAPSLLQHDTNVVCQKGKELYIADTLSRSYLPRSGGTGKFGTVNVVRHLPISTERMQTFKTCTNRDDTLQMLKHYDTARLARVEV